MGFENYVHDFFDFNCIAVELEQIGLDRVPSEHEDPEIGGHGLEVLLTEKKGNELLVHG